MFLISTKQKPQAMTYCASFFSDVIFFRPRGHFLSWQCAINKNARAESYEIAYKNLWITCTLQSIKNKRKYVYSRIFSSKSRSNKVKEFVPPVKGLLNQ